MAVDVVTICCVDIIFLFYLIFTAWEFSSFHGFLYLIHCNRQFFSFNFCKFILSVPIYQAVWVHQIHEFLVSFVFGPCTLISISHLSPPNQSSEYSRTCIPPTFQWCTLHVWETCTLYTLWMVLKGMNLSSCVKYGTFFGTVG